MWYFVAALTQLPSDTDEESAAPEKKEKKDPDLVRNMQRLFDKKKYNELNSLHSMCILTVLRQTNLMSI